MSRARSLSRLANANALSVSADLNVGIGSISPDAKLDVQGGDLLVGAAITMGSVSGIITATAFYGDGSNLEGVASAGLGTAISDTAPGDVIYYTNTTLGINTDITVDHPTTSNVSYTQYQEIAVADGIDFTVADGDEFIPDVLGLSTTGITPLAGAGGRIRADLFTNKAGNGAPTFQKGVVITGVATATTFSGNATSATTAAGLTGTPNITVGNITASSGDLTVRNIVGAAATFTGVLTYEDVANVDSVGLVTARTGVRVSAGGVVVTAGISTFKGAHFDGGLLKEKANIVANRLSDVSGVHVDLENGMTHVYTTNEDAGGASLAVNLRVSGSVELMDRLALGETISVNIITKPNGAGYIDEFTVDGQAVTEEWNGGSAPASAASGGYDLTTVQITRIASTGTENTDLLVQCNNSNFA